MDPSILPKLPLGGVPERVVGLPTVELVERVQVFAWILRVRGQRLLRPAGERGEEQLGVHRSVQAIVEAQLAADE